MPDPSGIDVEWRQWLGEEYAYLKPFIQPTQALAQSYPCPSPGGVGCPRGIHKQGEDEYVAFCRDVPKRCESVKLQRKDLIVYTFDIPSFCRHLARQLQFHSKVSHDDDFPFLWRVGKYIPIAGQRFAVNLVLASEKAIFDQVLDRLLVRENSPFIILCPTDSFLDDRHADLLNRKKASCLFLSETLGFDGEQITAAAPPEDIFAPFRRMALPGGHVDAGHAARLLSHEHRNVIGITERDRQEILGPRREDYDLIVDGFTDEVWHPEQQSDRPRRFDRRYYKWVLLRLAEAGRSLMPSQIGELNRIGQDKHDAAETDRARAEQINRMRRVVETDAGRKSYHYIKTVILEEGITTYHFNPDPDLRYALIFPPEDDE